MKKILNGTIRAIGFLGWVMILASFLSSTEKGVIVFLLGCSMTQWSELHFLKQDVLKIEGGTK